MREGVGERDGENRGGSNTENDEKNKLKWLNTCNYITLNIITTKLLLFHLYTGKIATCEFHMYFTYGDFACVHHNNLIASYLL